MATPFVSGALAILRQYFREGVREGEYPMRVFLRNPRRDPELVLLLSMPHVKQASHS